MARDPGRLQSLPLACSWAPDSVHYLEFLSYAEKYVAEGLHDVLARRDPALLPVVARLARDDVDATTTRLIEVSVGVADELGWLDSGRDGRHAPAWLPDDDPAWQEVLAADPGAHETAQATGTAPESATGA